MICKTKCASVLPELKLFTSSFLPKPTDILYIRNHLPQRKRQKIQELSKIIKSEFKKLLQKTSWMDSATKIRAIEKANGINEIIGAMGNYFNDSIFEHYEFTKKVKQKFKNI